MIDINELRLLVQDCKLAGSPVFVRVADMNEILDRIEAVEKERDAVLDCLNAWKELAKRWEKERDALRLDLAVARQERDSANAAAAFISAHADALQFKIEAMEKQEPVGEIQRANSTGNYICSEVWVPLPVGSKLYALPGAKGK